MKIVLISQNVFPGLLVFRKDLIQSLSEQGHDVYAFALDYSPESERLVERLGAVPVSYSLNKAGLNPFLDVRDVYRLYKQLKKLCPDVVFSFFVKPSIYGSIAAGLARVPHRVAMLEGLGYIHTPNKEGVSLKKRSLQIVHGMLSTFGYFFANKVLFLNKDDPKDLSRFSFLSKKKLQDIGPIGLDLESFPYVEPSVKKSVRFIFIARLLAEKGIFEYLEAARLVRKIYPESEFVVLGGLDSDNPTALTRAQLDEVIQENLIIYPGHVDDVNSWIAGADVFVLPSYREGFPRSTQEAMSAGRSVITTDVPGCRETVINGVSGFIVPPWDSAALADKMIYFIEQPEEIKVMGYQAHRIAVERFDVRKTTPLLERIIIGGGE